jgi:hypothetical protein
MRPVFWQMVGVLALAAILTIIYLNKKVDTLEAQIKKADEQRQLSNPTAANGAFTPKNPAS